MTPRQDLLAKDAVRIATMFDAIAGGYDLLNHLLSAGWDRRWRARAITALDLRGDETILDVCTGTGDLGLAARQGTTGARRVIGIDFSSAMLHVADEKVRRAGLESSMPLLRADASRLPIRDASVDGVMMAFGIRNVQDRVAVCAEMYRVLRVGGHVAVLELSLPRSPGLGTVYLWYFRRVLPWIGRVWSGHATAYRYLPESVSAFATPGEFAGELRSSGFRGIETVPLTFGVVYMFVGVKTVGGSPSA